MVSGRLWDRFCDGTRRRTLVDADRSRAYAGWKAVFRLARQLARNFRQGVDRAAHRARAGRRAGEAQAAAAGGHADLRADRMGLSRRTGDVGAWSWAGRSPEHNPQLSL